MASRTVTDRSELSVALSSMVSDSAGGEFGILMAGRRLDLYRTYAANCKDTPALPLIVLPGFGPSALELDAPSAMTNFKHFVRSQFGQRKRFCFVFDTSLDSKYRLVRATFGCQLAGEYTAHARSEGRQDVYIAIHDGEVVTLVHVGADWALVRTCTTDSGVTDWVPSAYLATIPL